MSAGELKGLGGQVAIGSHTLTHRRLGELADDEARRELAESKRQLEAAFGTEISSVALPHGDYNGRTFELAREAGYRRAYTIHLDTCRPGGDELVRGRFWGDLDGGRLEHWLKVRGAFGWMGGLQRLRHKATAKEAEK